MDDLIPISRQDGGVGIGNTRCWMVEIYSLLEKGDEGDCNRPRMTRI